MMTKTGFDAVKPLDSISGLERKQLAKYFGRIGRGVNCRLDVPVLVIGDIKWAAKIFGELSAKLQHLGFVDERSDIWRIMAARSHMEQARSDLAIVNKKEEATNVYKNLNPKVK